jgi:hypothetical protein
MRVHVVVVVAVFVAAAVIFFKLFFKVDKLLLFALVYMSVHFKH